MTLRAFPALVPQGSAAAPAAGVRVMASAAEPAVELGDEAALTADEIVGGAASEVLDRLDAVFAERDHHLRGHAVDLAQIVGNAKLTTLGIHFGLDLFQIFRWNLDSIFIFQCHCQFKKI